MGGFLLDDGTDDGYGYTRLLGCCLYDTVQMLFGLHGHNFVKAIQNQLAKGEKTLRVVADQISSPTWGVMQESILMKPSAYSLGQVPFL